MKTCCAASAKSCRNARKGENMRNIVLQRIINIICYIALGLAIGIGLCKFCKPFFMWAIGGVG